MADPLVISGPPGFTPSARPPGLRLALTDRQGVFRGEIVGASGRGVSRGLKVPRAARFTVSEGHPMRAALRQTDLNLLKVYDELADGTRRLAHVGAVTAYQLNHADTFTVQVGSTGPDWTLLRRLARAAAGGIGPIQRGALITYLLDLLNAGNVPLGVPASNTGIRARTINAPESIFLTGSIDYQKVSDVLAQAVTGLGPDWHVFPVEPTVDALGVQFGALDVVPIIGQNRPDVTFDHGCGSRNLVGWEETIDPSTIANRVYHLPTDFVAGGATGPTFATNAVSVGAHGVLEDVITADLTDPTLIAQLLQDHLDVRGEPRNVVSVTVATDPNPGLAMTGERTIPRPGIDYDFGDVVSLKHAETVPVLDSGGTVVGNVQEITQITARIYSLDIEDDDEGARTTSLTLVAS